MFMHFNRQSLSADDQCTLSTMTLNSDLVVVHLDMDRSEKCRYVTLHPVQIAKDGLDLVFSIAGFGRTDT